MTSWSCLLDSGASLLYSLFRFLLSTCLLFSLCQYMGWIHRFLHFAAEFWLSLISNGATITIGSFDYEFWHGRVLAYNVVIHTPLQDEWNWSSPILARAGRVYVEFSLVAWILSVVTLLSFERAPIDIYTVEVADVQVFIERHEKVFNFYLLDESIILPDPKIVVSSSCEEDCEEEEGSDVNPTTTTSPNMSSQQNEEAQQLVDQMLTTVQQLVSRKGNWKGAFDQQRHTLTSKLKEIQSTPNKVSAVQESVRVMRQVGEAVAKKTQDFPEVASPLRKPSTVPPPMVRVGRVVCREMRIFTRVEQYHNKEENGDKDEDDNVLLQEWNKPIRIDNVTVRASELTPPMSLTEGDSKLPAIYQPIDRVMDVVWKRLLAESAKSQTGRLLNAAVGQVLGIMKVGAVK